ncbi:hypothetical protein [Sphingobacterium bovistauri]|uniref:O-Antigen ligase n=1 Tax=Sphingobacterium bovistauri TaxID=2781959 RepID=A0ABS7Z1S5_9SPHI|nr:hypothetical protein [Sphingobacterium bovistauri]MCA5004123.1 hypothetical protein [Sphingobacterium bovistauri]
MIKNVILYIFVGLMVSLYFFPIGFTFLPSNINSKNLIALIGLILAVLHAAQNRALQINKDILGAIFIVICYCIVGYVSVDLNNTQDYSYANYFVSFTVWTFGAYFVCSLINFAHGDFNIRLLVVYLAYVGIFQCVSAFLINEIPIVKSLVNSFVEQGQFFLEDIRRWYGVGASLDSGGVRFCIILILIAGLLVKDEIVRSSPFLLISLVSSFFVIIIVGNIISRTTSVGSVIAILYLLLNTGMVRKLIPVKTIRFNISLLVLTGLFALLAIYLSQIDDSFYKNMRFAFEGFFNYIETGEWRTDSTDKLDDNMWIWPTDTKTWIIGSGKFEGFIYGTDIGYCRHILYNGIIGISIFSILFLYCFVVFANRYNKYTIVFFMLLCLGFIIWIKVSTDIYQIWAMLFVMTLIEKPDNKSLLLASDKK